MANSKFSELNEPDRLILMARIHHAIWYNDQCYDDLVKLLDTWQPIRDAVFFPQTNLQYDTTRESN